MTIELGALITGIVLAGTTVVYSLIVLCLAKKSDVYARIGIVCSQIATQVQKRYQCETEVTKLRLEEIRFEIKKELTPEGKKRLNDREEQFNKTITETQNEINNLERKLKRLEKELDNCQAKSREIIGFLLGRRK